MNWDALDECLYELLVLSDGGLGSYYGERMGRRARSLVVTVADAEHLLANEPPQAFETFLAIFGQIASRPADPLGRDIPRGQLFVLFSADPTNPPGPHYHLSA
ncbi:barstar (barnase inhibitor) [Pseudonocardia kunmingensis]|uniref:Barstar (Barnase inhibitor) n=1 Tax=Pseudonocardia kunmingensis TaxID=630975 RepID=A0A543E0K9_9PSEU|nr:barstar (barnase inhibitor) [Pseudonocardia kunmingensis]